MSRQAILESLDLANLPREIREINEANGWREGDPFDWSDRHKIPSALALIHSEISEAWEGSWGDDFDNFSEELADVLIRIVDMLEGLGLEAWGVIWGECDYKAAAGDDDTENMMIAHSRVSDALEAFRKDDKTAFSVAIGRAAISVIELCRDAEIGLSAAVRAKLAKNRERGYRHGGKRV